VRDPFGQLCADPLHVGNFNVEGSKVSFGAYSGTVAPNGSLQMQVGQTWVYGQFIGSHFEGRFWQPYPGCTYTLSLEPTA
jgi:hypothetical protein